MDNGYQILGLVEIADLLEVDTRTPHAWFYRGLMPDVEHPSVNGGRAWSRPTIMEWAARTGRLPEYLSAEGARYYTGPPPKRRGGRDAKAAGNG